MLFLVYINFCFSVQQLSTIIENLFIIISNVFLRLPKANFKCINFCDFSKQYNHLFLTAGGDALSMNVVTSGYHD
jgi:hypothetical protein